MSINIKRNQLKRVVIVGGGLGGLRLAEDLCNSNLQVVLIDKNNFHQFPPLIYQIASAGIDPSSISFPFRQIFRKSPRQDFRSDGKGSYQHIPLVDDVQQVVEPVATAVDDIEPVS